ncbi:peptidase S10 [Henriciella sp.]|uniref:S10 family peptidase n=1 Tax=Henriciella sp. TaxID=1968823 RepID=UPI002623908A|nr:peptidase S10 [Henriciella sp.]
MATRTIACLATAAILSSCASLDATPEPSSPEVAMEEALERSVQREGIFGGEPISYTAAVEELDLPARDERPAANLVSFSYVADSPTAGAERPVLFVFNGGPISASLWLHIGAVGPKRVSAPYDLSAPVDEFELVDNPHAPLDVADLVFFDPASTGFSTVAEGGDPTAFFSIEADAAQFVDFIEAWLERHDREGAPIYILGESYGTMRAAEAAGQLAEPGGPPPADGVFLMGQAVNIIEYAQRRQNIISYVVSLPTLAAMGWEQDRVVRKGRSFETFIADATAFGETDYLTALFQGNRLEGDELRRIADKLEEYTGIPAAYYVENRLRISKEQYRRELLKAESKVLGRSDGRYVGGDPQSDASGVVTQAYLTSFTRYVSEVFDLEIDESYRTLAEVGGLNAWGWGEASPFGHFDYSVRLEKAFEANPDFRLLVGNGYHDTMTTVGAADYLVAQADWPMDRVRLSYYQGGHMAYSSDESAEAFGQDIRDWIAGGEDWANGGE